MQEVIEAHKLSGLIDGNAPPFIVLVLVMGAIYNAQKTLEAAENATTGATFKIPVRRVVYWSIVVFIIVAALIICRIILHGFSDGAAKFYILDLVILFGIAVAYAGMTVDALALSQLRRKYKEETNGRDE